MQILISDWYIELFVWSGRELYLEDEQRLSKSADWDSDTDLHSPTQRFDSLHLIRLLLFCKDRRVYYVGGREKERSRSQTLVRNQTLWNVITVAVKAVLSLHWIIPQPNVASRSYFSWRRPYSHSWVGHAAQEIHSSPIRDNSHPLMGAIKQ